MTTDPERWYSGEYPGIIGNVSIAFIEPTLGGGKEYRCIYEADLDVDMIVLSPGQMEDAAKEGVLEWVMNRGYSVLYDAQNYAELLSKYVTHGQSRPELSEDEFKNIVNVCGCLSEAEAAPDDRVLLLQGGGQGCMA